MIRGKTLKSASIAAVVAIVLNGVALAGSIGIAPLRVDFDEVERNSVVRVVNSGTEVLSMQVEALDWSQADDGRDQYEATSDVIVVPPIFSIPPGETQLVRVGLLSEQPLETEQSYRLLFTELPPPMNNRAVTGLQLRMRVSIPVFSAAVIADEPELEFIEHEFVEDGRLRVKLRNNGKTHIRVSELTAFGLILDGNLEQGSDRELKLTSAKYLLGGVSRDFFFEVPQDYSIIRLVAQTDTAGIREFEVMDSSTRLRAVNETVGTQGYEVTTAR